jgi:hypothetical protein
MSSPDDKCPEVLERAAASAAAANDCDAPHRQRFKFSDDTALEDLITRI